MFGDFASIPPEKRNVIRLLFTRSHYRRTIKNWEVDARGLIAKLRLNAAQAADSAAFAALISELSSISADFRRLWAEHDVSDLGEGVTHFSSPREGATVFQHYTMMPEALSPISGSTSSTCLFKALSARVRSAAPLCFLIYPSFPLFAGMTLESWLRPRYAALTPPSLLRRAM